MPSTPGTRPVSRLSACLTRTSSGSASTMTLITQMALAMCGNLTELENQCASNTGWTLNQTMAMTMRDAPASSPTGDGQNHLFSHDNSFPSYFSNQYELKQFGWFDFKCDGRGFDIKWKVNMRALCERDVQVKGVIAAAASKQATPTLGVDGCYEGDYQASSRLQ